MSVTGQLPDSLTTWEVKAVGMFRTGESGSLASSGLVPWTRHITQDVCVPVTVE